MIAIFLVRPNVTPIFWLTDDLNRNVVKSTDSGAFPKLILCLWYTNTNMWFVFVILKFVVPKLMLHIAQTELVIQIEHQHHHHHHFLRPCAYRIASSSCISPIGTKRKTRQSAGGRTPATGRTSSEVFLSKSAVEDIEKFRDVPWSCRSCLRGGNCLHRKMIKLI